MNWRKSTYSASGNCVEVSEDPNGVLLRESDEPDSTILTSRENFAAFVAGVKAGEFDDMVETVTA